MRPPGLAGPVWADRFQAKLRAGRNRYAVPELYVTGASRASRSVSGSCGPLQKKTLRTLSTDP